MLVPKIISQIKIGDNLFFFSPVTLCVSSSPTLDLFLPCHSPFYSHFLRVSLDSPHGVCLPQASLLSLM